jgi:hypothetical protein
VIRCVRTQESSYVQPQDETWDGGGCNVAPLQDIHISKAVPKMDPPSSMS